MDTDNNLQILQQPESAVLFNDVCLIIDQARRHVATYVNVEACLMNWHVGKRIKEDVLYNQRAEYGKQILKNLSVKLTERYGTGWGTEKLKHCVRSAYLFSEDDIMYAARTQLTWTHLRSLMSLKDSLERQFYMEMCRIEHWDLCSEGNTEHIQYFMLDDDSDIRVAQYYTELPSKELLADRLQRAIAIAREHQIENK